MISDSIAALITTTGIPRSLPSLRTCATRGSSSTFASWSSFTFATKKDGLSVSRNMSRRICVSSSSAVSTDAAGLPSSSSASSLLQKTTAFFSNGSWPLAARSALSSLRCTVSRSFKISSVSIVSISAIGSTRLSTCTMFSSSKHRTTWATASASRILLKKALPLPSPFEAPFTSPAMSTNSTVAGTTFFGA